MLMANKCGCKQRNDEEWFIEEKKSTAIANTMLYDERDTNTIYVHQSEHRIYVKGKRSGAENPFKCKKKSESENEKITTNLVCLVLQCECWMYTIHTYIYKHIFSTRIHQLQNDYSFVLLFYYVLCLSYSRLHRCCLRFFFPVHFIIQRRVRFYFFR